MADIDMDAVLAQRAEAAGLDDPTAATFTFRSEMWTFPHPLFAGDEWKDGLSDLQATKKANDPDLARYYLGEEQYEKFLAAGGNSGIVLFAVAQVMQRATAEAQESGPTRSSTSSARRRKR